LGHRFVAGGDFNAKHWGSRIITLKGRQLMQAIEIFKLDASSGESYWPTDTRKIPD